MQHSTAGMQSSAINMCCKPFDDIRVRRAIVGSFDLDNVNSHPSYSTYRRSSGFFIGSDVAVFDRPSGGELALSEPLRTQPPAVMFTENVPGPSRTDPKTGVRPQSLKACALLGQAGYRYRNGRLEDRQGRPLTSELLSPSKTYEHVVVK